MTPLQIIFLLVGAVTLVSAIMVSVSPRMVHAALWLILALAGIAALFVLLNAGFLAVVQVAIYIDAIAILIIIVVMLTQRSMGESETQLNRTWWLGALAALLLFGSLLVLFTQAPSLTSEALPLTADAETILEDLGRSLVDVDRYILPFEVASILLLAALIGSIMVARPVVGGREEGDER
jgi:NADH-quinone oxidoreductase subunit J